MYCTLQINRDEKTRGPKKTTQLPRIDGSRVCIQKLADSPKKKKKKDKIIESVCPREFAQRGRARQNKKQFSRQKVESNLATILYITDNICMHSFEKVGKRLHIRKLKKGYTKRNRDREWFI
jgi:predicted glycosyltransferase involved in capsule biosynthesis